MPTPGTSDLDERPRQCSVEGGTSADVALSVLETLQAKAPVGFGFVDRSLRVVRVNEAMAKIFGLDGDVVGRHIAEVLPGLWTRLEPTVEHVLATGQSVLDVEVEAESAGTTRALLASFYPVALDGETIGVGSVVVDVTDRKRSEQARGQLSAIVDGSGDAIFGVTVDGVLTSCNLAAQRMFGYSADEMVGRPVSIIAPPRRTDEQREMRERLILGGPPERLETVRLRNDGSPVDVLVTASTTTDENGTVTGLAVIMQDIGERLAAQRALEASRRRLAEAQRTARLGSFEYDVRTEELTWSDEYYRILKLDQRIIASTRLFMLMVHPDDVTPVQRVWLDARHRGNPFDLEFRVITVGGEQRTVNARAVAEMNETGEVVKLSGTMMDITDRAEADRVRWAAEARFEIGFEQSAIGAAIADLDGIPTRVNSAVCAILGRPADQLVGRRWVDFIPPDDVPLCEAVLARITAGHDLYHDERQYIRPDGTAVWTSCNVSLVRDTAGTPQYLFVQMQDINSRKLMELELAHQAVHDSLTGLPNRALLTDRLNHGLAGTRRRNTQIGVMFLDLDQFKLVNDSAGHETGDRLLIEIAERIVSAVRPDDTVARFGGDEFVIICDDVSAADAQQIGERVLESVRRPARLGDQEMFPSVSLGIAMSDQDSTPASLLRDSDAAMFLAKERGRGRLEVFGETLRTKAERQWVTSTDLHRALDRDELTIHYQPVIDLATGEMVSAEALVRWIHPERGLVGPDEFIRFAEETGLIVPIGTWVLETACAQLVEWQALRRAGGTVATLSMAVNLSVRQMLATGVVALIREVLGRTGIDPADLCLELTESVFMEDVAYFGSVLADIKAIGVDLAIDDFGTGYSSLSYLKRFPVDRVKIDRAFVDGLGVDAHDTALVAAIVAMAGALDLAITAEGVETCDQLAELRRLGVSRAQGFLLARPMPAEELTRMITEARRWSID
ncbi:MAG: hypothetical protein JWL72_2479 [Ilumatobacteraceae bacterium]|nr:hypothetical protein [Ilumatobacteraceae bacterium]